MNKNLNTTYGIFCLFLINHGLTVQHQYAFEGNIGCKIKHAVII